MFLQVPVQIHFALTLCYTLNKTYNEHESCYKALDLCEHHGEIGSISGRLMRRDDVIPCAKK